MTETKTEWYFIVNPRAGSGKTMSEWVPAEHRLDKLGVPYITAYTDHKKHATQIAYEASLEGYRHIAAVGGDGSLHETITGICKYCDETGTPTEEFYLAVVPIGSGNDWIKSLAVPHDTTKVIDMIAARSFGRMDVVRVDGFGGKVSYMANIGGLGFDSHVCKRVNAQKESGLRGKSIYLNSLLHTIRTIKAINIRVTADGNEIFSGPCFSVALGNGRYSGSGMRQVPLAVIDDDMLDCTVIPKQPLPGLVKELPRLFKGTINETDKVISFRCSSILIEPLDEDSDDIFEIDGEIEGRIPLTISMAGRQINVLKG